MKQTFFMISTGTCKCTVYNADPAVMETLGCELLTAPIAHSYLWSAQPATGKL